MAKTEEKVDVSLERQHSGTQKYGTRKGKIIILFLNYDFVISAYRPNHFRNPSDSDITDKQHPIGMAKEAYLTHSWKGNWGLQKASKRTE